MSLTSRTTVLVIVVVAAAAITITPNVFFQIYISSLGKIGAHIAWLTFYMYDDDDDDDYFEFDAIALLKMCTRRALP